MIVILSPQAKKSVGHSTTKASKPGGFAPGGFTGGGFAEEPPIGTEPLTPATANNSASPLAIAHRLLTTSVNASKTQAKLGTPCLPELSRFILPPKEAQIYCNKGMCYCNGYSRMDTLLQQ